MATGKANPKYRALLVNSDTLSDELDINDHAKTKLLRKMRANEWISPGGNWTTDQIVALALQRVETGGDKAFEEFLGFMSTAGLKVATTIQQAGGPSPAPSPSKSGQGQGTSSPDPLDLLLVKEEVLPIASRWKSFGLALGLRSDVLDRVEGDYRKIDDCLQAMLKEWVESYETLRGPPSWQLLVEAVASPAGGNNQALAHKIADKHNVTVPSRK